MSDQNKATGVDYAQLGVSIASSISLGKIRRLQEDEARKNALESELRQFIFELENGLYRLINGTYLRFNPLGGAVATTMIQWMLKEVDFDPSMFEQFVDKDRARDFLEHLETTKRTCLDPLSKSEKESIEKYAHACYHGESLAKLIKHLKAEKELKKTDQQWRQFSGPADSWAALAWGSFVVGFAFLLVSVESYNNGFWPVIYWLITAGMVVLFIWSLVKHSKATNITGYQDLKQKRDGIKAMTLSFDQLEEIYKDIPKGSSIEEYEKMLVEINKLYDSLFHDTNGKTYAESLLFVVFPKKFVEEKLGHPVS